MIGLASSRIWDKEFQLKLELKLKEKIYLISSPEELVKDQLLVKGIKKIYFPHWSYIIKPEIFNTFECVIFHMTDLPFGRGGSPLQNLIARGIYQTKISALKCSEGIDTGPVYLKHDLKLDGSAQEIFERASDIILDMIIEIESKKMVPVEQIGEAVLFKRRKPEDSSMASLDSLVKIYDYIRMLDAKGYPNAFIELNGIKYEFFNATMNENEIIAQVRIKK